MTYLFVVVYGFVFFFFFKQKTAYEMRISDWSSDVCSSDLIAAGLRAFFFRAHPRIGWQGAWPLADGACANARLAGGGRTVLGPYLYAGPSNGTGILSQVRLHTLHAAGGDFRRSTPPWLSTKRGCAAYHAHEQTVSKEHIRTLA